MQIVQAIVLYRFEVNYMNNKIKQIAELYNLELNQPFEIGFTDEEESFGRYYLSENGLEGDIHRDELDVIFISFLTGKCEVKKVF